MPITLTEQAVQRLISARRARNWTREDLSVATKPHPDATPRVCARTIADLEALRRLIFHESTLTHLCRILGLSLEELTARKNTLKM